MISQSCFISVLLARAFAAKKSGHGGFGLLGAEEVAAARPLLRTKWEEAGGRCTWAAFREAKAVDHSDSPGCQNDALMAALMPVYVSPGESGAFLDVGAHVGQWTAEVLSKFGRLEHKKYAKEFGASGYGCRAPADPAAKAVSIYCFEPVKASYDRLSDRAKRSAWLLEDVQFMRAGVANATGKASVWAASGTADPKASLTPQEGAVESTERMVTIDLLLKKSVAGGRAFLLRLAINGHEHGALVGAKKSLKNHLVRFVQFEVSPLWKQAGYHLKDTLALLWKAEYACFALLPHPIPLSGSFWQEFAEGPAWFQVFCGVLGDQGLRQVIRALDVDGIDYLKTSP